jgi:hypothetical protein
LIGQKHWGLSVQLRGADKIEHRALQFWALNGHLKSAEGRQVANINVRRKATGDFLG